MTRRLQEALAAAEHNAAWRGSREVTPEDLLLGLLRIEPGVGVHMLEGAGISTAMLRQELGALNPRCQDSRPSGRRHLARSTLRLLKAARHEAASLNHLCLGTEHIVLGLLRERNSPAAQLLQRKGLTPGPGREALVDLLGG